MRRSHPTRSHLVPRAPSSCDSISSLYTSPTSTDTLPVYESITLTWNPACVDVGTEQVDLYLNVVEQVGLVAVHEWTGVEYGKGELVTQLKPGWWNASTGAGEVQAQLGIVPAGQPIWNTPAPAGPLFTVSYNGSYPSVTNSAPEPIYTGPSVESVADKNTQSPPVSGGKLGAAVGVPLLVVAIAVIAYVTWNRMRKRPEKKRFSAVVDKRMSMMSQGTWQPRPSMAQSRPGSHHRPSGSMYSTANRHSYFADPQQRNSTYSMGGSSPLRPPQPAEMRKREIGEGDRISRVSFAGGSERPSFSSSRAGGGGGGGGGKASSMYERKSLHQSQLSRSSNSPPQHSPPLSGLTSSQSSSSLLSQSSRFEDPISRSGTTEELRDSPSVNQLRPLALSHSHSHKPSTSSSLRNAHSNNNSDDPFLTPSSQTRPKLSPLAMNSSFTGMKQFSPISGDESVLSPDQALASYSVARALSPAPPTQLGGIGTGAGGGRIGSMKNLFRRMKSSGSLNRGEDAREEERGESPFGDEHEHGHVIPEMREQGGMDWDDQGEGEGEKEYDEKATGSWKGGNAY